MDAAAAPRIRVVDSHTGGEPTRVVLEGGPVLEGPFADRVKTLRSKHDSFRTALVAEPRGAEALVGALLTPPTDPSCAAGVIYFDNAGYLGMCGHGTIGLVVTLAWLGRLSPGSHRIETPVGIVTATLHDAHTVSVHNVPAWRARHGVSVEVPGHGKITGDVAWGGNWFFIVEDHGQRLDYSNVRALSEFCERVKAALARDGITGTGGALIDHVELSDDVRNFVLCPGGAYDRSPCGTGTSAKIACLAAEGVLAPGALWRQRSITGSVFEASYTRDPAQPERILPTIRGQAWVTGEASLVLDPADPLRHGLAGAT